MQIGLTLTELCFWGQRLYPYKGKSDFCLCEGAICSSDPVATGSYLSLTHHTVQGHISPILQLNIDGTVGNPQVLPTVLTSPALPSAPDLYFFTSLLVGNRCCLCRTHGHRTLDRWPTTLGTSLGGGREGTGRTCQEEKKTP